MGAVAVYLIRAQCVRGVFLYEPLKHGELIPDTGFSDLAALGLTYVLVGRLIAHIKCRDRTVATHCLEMKPASAFILLACTVVGAVSAAPAPDNDAAQLSGM